jgi:hypothetical protein
MMTSNKKNKGASRRKGGQDETASLLKQLISLNSRQTVRDEPTVPDVQPSVLKRHRLYTFQRGIDLGIITPSVTVETFTSYTFTLGALPDSTEFTALFDQYRILQVRMEFTPLFTDTSATVAYPPIYTAIDYDDANSVTGAQINEYDSVMFTPTGTYFERCFNPRIALAAYSGAFTSFGQPQAGFWIDCASPSVVHYGLKTVMPVAGAANQVWSVRAHLQLQFRESR